MDHYIEAEGRRQEAEKRPLLSAAPYILLLVLLAAGVLTLVLPGKDFSDRERRLLAEAPANLSLTDWHMNNDLESYLSDHMPGRDAMITVNAVYNLLTGRGSLQGAWLAGDRLTEPPVDTALPALQRTCSSMLLLAEKYGVPCYIITPPSAGTVTMDKTTFLRRRLFETEKNNYLALTANDRYVPLTDAFMNDPSLYYRTDHHWTLEGAYTAYTAYCAKAGLTPADISLYTLSEWPDFHGTNLSRSGLPAFTSDPVTAAEPLYPVRCTFDGQTYDHLIFPERAQTYDMYAVYLDGNHGVTVLENDAAENGTLFVLKDSFANSLLPFLTSNWRRIVCVDARYLPAAQTLDDILQGENTPDSMLFVYSLDSYSDSKVLRLLRQL